jgi:type IV pili sensor histidine kinase/response regulator
MPRILALALLLVVAGAWATPPDHVRLARYTVAEPAPAAAVVDPLAVVATVHFPREQVRTVGDAVDYLLLRTGYRVASADAAATALLALPLPESHRVLGPFPARAILQVLLGDPYHVNASPVDRTLAIGLRGPRSAESSAVATVESALTRPVAPATPPEAIE